MNRLWEVEQSRRPVPIPIFQLPTSAHEKYSWEAEQRKFFL